ncbi:glycosyltransferase [Tautonia plasticadhaerens]|uniref:D-inositol 3-phosphate glycosyltransferase n=1 Tax=Tautonia plasticadhaerens TaxID=2527974 RepID=A0A518HFT4_9BACT|nr:glycosyltransferase [Tautonia plasticadhaerens]QDV39717.1 D-inositol 3-phosphate glycosyltransferase [Tautonia plasticadhaerens]
MSPRPTICQVLHGLEVGGAEVLAAIMARRLGDEFRFVFACLDDLGTLGEALRDEGFPVEVFGRRPGLDGRCALNLATLLRRERVDVLHAHQYTPFFYGLIARRLYRRPAILFTEHGRHFPDYPRRKRIVANRLLLERRDRVVGVGRAVRKALIENEGIPAERVEVVYNGIDLDPSDTDGDREGVRRELGIGPDDPMAIQVARLDPLKDHVAAVRAMGLVTRRHPDARLVLVGEGPERPAIEREVRRLDLGRNVLLLGLRRDVSRLLSGADLALLTSISEGIPLTLIEAMAAGLPVVSTDVGGVAEVVEPGRTGLLAPAGDPEAIADRVATLIGEDRQRAELGDLGRQRARELFSETRMVGHYAELYARMSAGRIAAAVAAGPAGGAAR